MSRLTWDEYFIQILHSVAARATCNRGRSGCVIVRNGQIVSTGYVGSPSGLAHCDDVGHDIKLVTNVHGRPREHCVRTVHAEQNAICQAAKNGVCLDKSTLYCTMTPCRACAMMIINTGIKQVVCETKYHDSSDSERMFEEAGIAVTHLTAECIVYPDNMV